MKCKKCSGENLVMRPNAKNPSATELICADCGTWQKFIGKEEIRLFEIKNQPLKPKPTNADKIRGMSDEELANLLWEQNGSNRYWKSVQKYLDWLRQPAETEGTE